MKNTHEKIQTNFHSIASAAGALGVPVSVLRGAKKAGAAGFRANGNLDLPEFVRWLLGKGQDFKPRRNLEESKALLAEAQANRITNQAAIERGELCPIEKQARALHFTVWALALAIKQSLAVVAHKIDENHHAEISEVLRLGFQEALLNAAAGNCAHLELPDWAVEALRTGAETGLVPDEADFKKRMDVFGDVLAGCAVDRIIARLENQSAKP
ncbi:MAG: hypothetical protein ABSF51_12740 [Verrucomicrobiota bacterium]|jgi:hypothetical protein